MVVIAQFCNPNQEADPMSTCVAQKKSFLDLRKDLEFFSLIPHV